MRMVDFQFEKISRLTVLRYVDSLSSHLEKIFNFAEGADMISPQQIRRARAMLGMTQADLAVRASLSST